MVRQSQIPNLPSWSSFQKPRKKPGPKPGSEAARRGGLALAAKMRGTNYYQNIGKAGGDTTIALHGVEHLAEAGSMGGVTTAALYGPDHMSRIGARGRGIAQKRKQQRPCKGK